MSSTGHGTVRKVVGVIGSKLESDKMDDILQSPDTFALVVDLRTWQILFASESIRTSLNFSVKEVKEKSFIDLLRKDEQFVEMCKDLSCAADMKDREDQKNKNDGSEYPCIKKSYQCHMKTGRLPIELPEIEKYYQKNAVEAARERCLLVPVEFYGHVQFFSKPSTVGGNWDELYKSRDGHPCFVAAGQLRNTGKDIRNQNFLLVATFENGQIMRIPKEPIKRLGYSTPREIFDCDTAEERNISSLIHPDDWRWVNSQMKVALANPQLTTLPRAVFRMKNKSTRQYVFVDMYFRSVMEEIEMGDNRFVTSMVTYSHPNSIFLNAKEVGEATGRSQPRAVSQTPQSNLVKPLSEIKVRNVRPAPSDVMRSAGIPLIASGKASQKSHTVPNQRSAKQEDPLECTILSEKGINMDKRKADQQDGTIKKYDAVIGSQLESKDVDKIIHRIDAFVLVVEPVSGRILYVSDSVETALRLCKYELKKANFWDYFGEDDQIMQLMQEFDNYCSKKNRSRESALDLVLPCNMRTGNLPVTPELSGYFEDNLIAGNRGNLVPVQLYGHVQQAHGSFDPALMRGWNELYEAESGRHYMVVVGNLLRKGDNPNQAAGKCRNLFMTKQFEDGEIFGASKLPLSKLGIASPREILEKTDPEERNLSNLVHPDDWKWVQHRTKMALADPREFVRAVFRMKRHGSNDYVFVDMEFRVVNDVKHVQEGQKERRVILTYPNTIFLDTSGEKITAHKSDGRRDQHVREFTFILSSNFVIKSCGGDVEALTGLQKGSLEKRTLFYFLERSNRKFVSEKLEPLFEMKRKSCDVHICFETDGRPNVDMGMRTEAFQEASGKIAIKCRVNLIDDLIAMSSCDEITDSYFMYDDRYQHDEVDNASEDDMAMLETDHKLEADHRRVRREPEPEATSDGLDDVLSFSSNDPTFGSLFHRTGQFRDRKGMRKFLEQTGCCPQFDEGSSLYSFLDDRDAKRLNAQVKRTVGLDSTRRLYCLKNKSGEDIYIEMKLHAYEWEGEDLILSTNVIKTGEDVKKIRMHEDFAGGINWRKYNVETRENWYTSGFISED